MGRTRISPNVNTVYTVPHAEYIEARMEETGYSWSGVVREVIQFRIDHEVKPRLIRKIADEAAAVAETKPTRKSKIAA